MLKTEDNERLTRVSPGTPMGELMRRYWQPALLSWELPEPDGAPIRVRLLGEDLIAFRDTDGKVGLVDAYCPHRRAPMFYGRNEESGIRCVYHGWKFNTVGACVDLPSEPADSPMKSKARIKAYPTYEKGAVIWAYMGPKEEMPEPPDFEWMRASDSHRHVSKTFEHCNWLQALEGGLDTSHSSHLHNENLKDKGQWRQRDKAPLIEVETTDYGYCYASLRNAGDDGTYVRFYQYIMPVQQQRGAVTGRNGRNAVPKLNGHLWVPVDDEHTFVYNTSYVIDPETSLPPVDETNSGRGPDDLIPGTFVLKRNPTNDHLIDRERQKTMTATGIKGINTQDFAVQEGMGPIVDRSREYLGSSDRAIIAMRNLLLEATRAVERGERPPAWDPTSCRTARAFDTVVPPDTDWREAMAKDLQAKW